MRKTIISLLSCSVCLLALVSCSKAQDIPDAVSSHFKSAYPGAQLEDWDKERDGSFEAEFNLNGKQWEAYYAVDGSWVRTERDVTRTEVPKAVWESLAASEHASWKTDDLEEHQTPQHKSVYEIEVKKGLQKTYLYFLPDGTQLR